MTRKLPNPGATSWLAVAVLILLTVPSGWSATYKVLHHFGSGQDGVSPWAAPIVDEQGNLFGTTGGGGSNGGGTVYELTPDPDGTWKETVIHNFSFDFEGTGPVIGVVLDDVGNLYGTTTGGGPTNQGTVFQLMPDSDMWTVSVLYNIGSRTGVTLDNPGNIYGPVGPGDYQNGAVAELSPGPSGWSYMALYSFCRAPKCPDGTDPQGPFAWDAAGNLYGVTLYGGIFPFQKRCADTSGCGVVFQLKPRPDGTWRYRILHWFGAYIDDGQLPNGGLVVDSKGNVYGSTGFGGPAFTGTVFKLSPKPPGQWGQSIGYVETQLYTFPDCSQGCGPENPLVMDKAGNLYGTAGGGNTSCNGFYCGVVFRLSPQPDGTWKYTVLHKFSGSDGMGPAGITLDANGSLFGATRAGGQYNLGVAFQITP